MQGVRFLAVLLAGAFAWAGTAAAAVDSDMRPHHLKKRGVHWQPGATRGTPGPGPAWSHRGKVKVLGHHDPAGGAPAGDVVAHRGFAYLGSWGLFSENGEFCRANGVRV